MSAVELVSLPERLYSPFHNSRDCRYGFRVIKSLGVDDKPAASVRSQLNAFCRNEVMRHLRRHLEERVPLAAEPEGLQSLLITALADFERQGPRQSLGRKHARSR